MSAKAAYRKPDLNLPELPPELWIQIIREATRGAAPLGPLSSRWIWPRQFKSPSAYKHWRYAIVTKRYIVRVCKQWYLMGIPFLYEHLMLTRLNHSKSMIGVVAQRSSLDPSLEPFGSYARRLEIGFHDYNDEGETVNANLTALLERLPRLISIVFDCPGLPFGDPDTCPVYFFQSAPQSLEYFDWGPDPDVFPFSHWLNFINTHPNLRIVNGPNAETYFDEEETEEKLGKVTTFEHLFQLGMSGYDAGEFYCTHLPENMPSLRGFAIEWPPFLEIEIYQSLFARFGQNLTALYLEYEDEDEEDLQIAMDRPLGSLLKLCPRLEEIFISAWWRTDIKIDAPTESVRLFGIKFADRQLTARHCKSMLKQLTKAKTWFPNLKAIRFFEETNLIHLRGQHLKRLQRGITEFHNAGLVVEDSDERPILFTISD
ncbi:hypothetical protein BKA70DRAFT_43221 [Coprinopsis sp. MPI-PUGE-AT-0042]|nr:hypothetical protein BKA70DRAFT_43221 [Coprinopsis sp. MPI-PUGE-AT-0042]